MSRSKTKPPVNETKHDRWKRLAEARTRKILTAVKTLGKLGFKSRYDYSEDEVKKIFDAIDKSLAEVKKRFAETASCEESDFRL